MRYPWWDRCLIDLAPDGQRFMTVDHGLPVEAFGFDREETFVEWSGGYLTADLDVVTLGGR